MQREIESLRKALEESEAGKTASPEAKEIEMLKAALTAKKAAEEQKAAAVEDAKKAAS